MVAASSIEDLNKRFYSDAKTATSYAQLSEVLPEERAFLRDYAADLVGSSVLDMGVGGGRSTAYLLPVVGDYVGFDYAPEMVRLASAAFPSARLEVRDARDLSCYGDASYDVVLFSFNGLDCLAHAGRLQVLRGARRVLKPGGLLAFSSHNRATTVSRPYAPKNLSLSLKPHRMACHVFSYFRGILSWWCTRATAHACAEYELRHDCGSGFRVPLYYITRVEQERQLAQRGFRLCSIYDGEGRSVNAMEVDASSAWFFYAARKVS